MEPRLEAQFIPSLQADLENKTDEVNPVPGAYYRHLFPNRTAHSTHQDAVLCYNQTHKVYFLSNQNVLKNELLHLLYFKLPCFVLCDTN